MTTNRANAGKIYGDGEQEKTKRRKKRRAREGMTMKNRYSKEKRGLMGIE